MLPGKYSLPLYAKYFEVIVAVYFPRYLYSWGNYIGDMFGELGKESMIQAAKISNTISNTIRHARKRKYCPVCSNKILSKHYTQALCQNTVVVLGNKTKYYPLCSLLSRYVDTVGKPWKRKLEQEHTAPLK